MNRTVHPTASQFSRYVAVGSFNTLFGYALFALLNFCFRHIGDGSYMYAAALANLVAITVAFLGYKWFVFRTRGNYLLEWLRCLSVYGTSALAGLICLPILVSVLRPRLPRPGATPYLAAAIVTALTVFTSFLGHKRFSFRVQSR